jgi:hypothetical protein
MTKARKIAYLYLELPYHKQVEVAKKFGFDLTAISNKTDRDTELFQCIRKQNKFDAFLEELEKCTNERN